MTIELRAIELFAYHGVLEHERRDGQRFFVDVELDYEGEAAAASVISLPIYPELTREQQDAVIDAVLGFYV